MKKKLLIGLCTSVLMVNLVGCTMNQPSTPAPDETETVENVAPESTTGESTTGDETTPAEETYTEEQQTLLGSVNGISSLEGTLTMAVKMQIPMSASEKAEYESLGNDASYAFHSINMGAQLEIASTDTISHYQGTISKVGTSSVIAKPINIYTDSATPKMYDLSYNEKTGSQTWVQNEDYTESLLSIIRDILGHTNNISNNNTTTTKVVKGVVNSKYIYTLPCFREVSNEYFTLDTTKEIELPVKIVVNGKTGYLSSIEITLDDLLGDINAQSVSTEPLKITLKSTNSTNIAIPEEALNTTGKAMDVVAEDISIFSKYFKSIYAPAESDASEETTIAIIQSVLGNKYDNLLKDGEEYTNITLKITDFLNYYSVEDLHAYMQYYKYCAEDEQAAICILAQIGVPDFDEAYMQKECIGDSRTLDDVINDYKLSQGIE